MSYDVHFNEIANVTLCDELVKQLDQIIYGRRNDSLYIIFNYDALVDIMLNWISNNNYEFVKVVLEYAKNKKMALQRHLHKLCKLGETKIILLCCEYFEMDDIGIIENTNDVSYLEFLIYNFTDYLNCRPKLLASMFKKLICLNYIPGIELFAKTFKTGINLHSIINDTLQYNLDDETILKLLSLESEYGKINIYACSCRHLLYECIENCNLDIIKFIHTKYEPKKLFPSIYDSWINSGKFSLDVLKYLYEYHSIYGCHFELSRFSIIITDYKYRRRISAELLEYVYNTFVHHPYEAMYFIKGLGPFVSMYKHTITNILKDCIKKYGLSKIFSWNKYSCEIIIKLIKLDTDNILDVRFAKFTECRTHSLIPKIVRLIYHKYNKCMNPTKITDIIGEFYYFEYGGGSLMYVDENIGYLTEIYPELIKLSFSKIPISYRIFYDRMRYKTSNRKRLAKCLLYLKRKMPSKTKYYDLLPMETRVSNWKKMLVIQIKDYSCVIKN